MSGFSDLTQSTEKTQDYSNVRMIGRVVDNNDPKKFHRIRVEVPDIIEGDAANLPWAIPETLPGGGGAQSASQNIPMIDSLVFVYLQNGDPHFPVYGGQVSGHKTELGVLAENYPNRVGWQRQGHHVFTDHQSNLYEYLHLSGFKISVTADGSLTVTGPKDATVNLTGNLNIQVNGNATVQVNGTMNAHANGNLTVSTDGSGTVSSNGALTVHSGGALTLEGNGGVTIRGPSIDLVQ